MTRLWPAIVNLGAIPTFAITACRQIFDQAIDGVWAGDHIRPVADPALPTRA